ncbi:MAG: L-seryl-tRNA(Sec) selenium transferase [Proteobacteria bacterium]|nr:L-seryl-tRNA(Sec) selenium transferase [Pseudomonadota bacterium]
MVEQKKNQNLKDLPSVNEILKQPHIAGLIAEHGRIPVKHNVREAISRARAAILKGDEAPDIAAIVSDVTILTKNLTLGSLRPVINATGVILHTNLGRAPLGKAAIEEIARIVGGYSSLEFDLARGRRGNRSVHVRDILKLLTSAEDLLVVNNNAAGIVLALNTLAKGKEVIISRGELIEIGGSFRIPDIMAASGAKMVEVGTTNRTRISDYEAAIGPDTALIFKAHTSNYAITGFTEEVSVEDLSKLAHDRGLIMMYDIGSGLLYRPKGLSLASEPDVKGSLEDGADLVAFSCDKLLGGPQAGVLAGRKEIISRLMQAPLMRALRVCKLTYAALLSVCKGFFKNDNLVESNPTFAMLERTPQELEDLASNLQSELERLGVAARTVKSSGQCGGGTLPDLQIPSFALEILPLDGVAEGKQTFAEVLYKRLLNAEPPILAVLREGRILLDVLTLFKEEIPIVAKAILDSIKAGE